MKDKVVSNELHCDVCGKKDLDHVYDTPIGGRWGYICATCAAEYRIDTQNANGTHLKRAGRDIPEWREKFPELVKLVEQAKQHVDEYGETYITALDDCWALYGEDGLRHQLPYIVENAPGMDTVLKAQLMRMSNKRLS